MNPSPSFSFLPPPNPNPNFFPPQHHHNRHQPSSSSAATTNTPTQPPDLHTTLSSLRHLIHLSKTTINSISSLLPTSASTAAVATCPYNSNHRVPPNSLFHHHLQCPSSPAPIDLALLNSLHYPKTFQSAQSLIDQKNIRFDQALPEDANTDLCFTLDDYRTSLDSNFFYRDCPAVVKFPLGDSNADLMLTLPVVLSAECANFTGNGNDGIRDTIDGLFSSCYLIELPPSEYWNVKTEINQWNDYPAFYSYGVLQSVLCLYRCQKEYLMEWLMVNSPCYGIVIDRFMGDHIFLLFRLCLKAIAREAVISVGSFSREEPKGGKHHFECPVLVRVLTWLASQLAVLYGEVNGKLFAINMLKQCLLIALSKSLFFPGEETVSESFCSGEVDGKLEPPTGSKEKDKRTMEMIFVSQVAAAVAALHERSSLETRIKAIRGLHSLPIYQRTAEHVYISKKAEEERKKRPNWRSIIEHDGVLWQRRGDQDTNKKKSKEELLAEERDYKRRRMSYRGKKIKRSTIEVTRDIIEEYMEEIKQASMVGQPPDDARKLESEPFSMCDLPSDNEVRVVIPNPSKLNRGETRSDWEDSVSDFDKISARSEDVILGKNNKQRYEGHHQESLTVDESRYGREHYSRNSDGHRSTSLSHDRRKRTEHRLPRKYHHPSPDIVHSSSHERVSHLRDQLHENVEHKDSRQRSRYKDKRASPHVRNEFEDRYDPSKSHDINDDSLYSDS